MSLLELLMVGVILLMSAAPLVLLIALLIYLRSLHERVGGLERQIERLASAVEADD